MTLKVFYETVVKPFYKEETICIFHEGRFVYYASPKEIPIGVWYMEKEVQEFYIDSDAELVIVVS